jgi:hypothetical protein
MFASKGCWVFSSVQFSKYYNLRWAKNMKISRLRRLAIEKQSKLFFAKKASMKNLLIYLATFIWLTKWFNYLIYSNNGILTFILTLWRHPGVSVENIFFLSHRHSRQGSKCLSLQYLLIFARKDRYPLKYA